MKIACLVKQVSPVSAIELDEETKSLPREGVPLEPNELDRSVRDVPIVSATAKTRSDRCTLRSAPRATVSRRASAYGGPIVILLAVGVPGEFSSRPAS